MCVGEVICHKKSSTISLSERKFDPPPETPGSTPVYYNNIAACSWGVYKDIMTQSIIPTLCLNIITSLSKSLSMNAPPNMAAMTSDLAFNITLCP